MTNDVKIPTMKLTDWARMFQALGSRLRKVLAKCSWFKNSLIPFMSICSLMKSAVVTDMAACLLPSMKYSVNKFISLSNSSTMGGTSKMAATVSRCHFVVYQAMASSVRTSKPGCAAAKCCWKGPMASLTPNATRT